MQAWENLYLKPSPELIFGYSSDVFPIYSALWHEHCHKLTESGHLDTYVSSNNIKGDEVI